MGPADNGDSDSGWAVRRHLSRARLDLPLGIVDAAEVRFDEGTLAEVTLTIVGAPLLFVAAEFYENNDGTLHLNRCDESVLVFTNLADAAALTWIPARHV